MSIVIANVGEHPKSFEILEASTHKLGSVIGKSTDLARAMKHWGFKIEPRVASRKQRLRQRELNRRRQWSHYYFQFPPASAPELEALREECRSIHRPDTNA